MSSNNNFQAQYRTEQKLRYAQIHLNELLEYPSATSNDEWENAHQESFFFHLAGTVEAVLHEINAGYSLALDSTKVTWTKISKQLATTNQSSPAYDRLTAMRSDSAGWLSLLFEWRNHGTHRDRVAKHVHMSNWQKVDNEFTVPKTGQLQSVYPGAGCIDVVKYLLRDVRSLIDECRKFDAKL